jgi:hypothetical protein
MTDNNERRLLSSDIVAPKIMAVFEAKIPFGLWAKNGVEYFDVLLNLMKKADFHVILINSANMEKADFEKDGILGYSNFIKEVEKARENNTKIAFFFKNMDRSSADVVRALQDAICSRRIGDIKLEPEDLVFLTGLVSDDGELEHSISASVMNRMAHFIMD